MGTLLPTPPDPDLPPTLQVVPLRVTPTGLGGFVGLHRDPPGEILGRRLRAEVWITVRVGRDGDLNAAVAEVTRALLAADREQLHGSGILRLALDELGAPGSSGAGANQVSHRELRFAALYEHLHTPSAGEGVIETVPLQVALAPGPEALGPVPAPGPPPPPGPAEPEPQAPLYRADFATDPLGDFEVVDDPQATQGGPSQWRHDAAGERVEQTTSIRGGSYGINPNKPGTYLVLRATPERPAVGDFTLDAELSSGDPDSIGVVFRWQGVDDFYFFVLDQRRGYRMFARKRAGAFEDLSTPAVDLSAGFELDRVHAVRITVRGDRFEARVDGVLVLEAQDDAIPQPGRVGLVCRSNDQARFHRLELRSP